jgi:dTDP-4-amino-4,6-dideoxygalactose transaminase
VAVRGIRIINPNENTKANYAYLPIIIDPGEFGGQRDDLLKFLKNHKIFARPYFHPLITDFPAFSMFRKSNLDTATSISNNILCLPLFYNISVGEIERVVEVIRDFQKIQSHHRF